MSRPQPTSRLDEEQERLQRASALQSGIDFGVLKRFRLLLLPYWTGPAAARAWAGVALLIVVLLSTSLIEGGQSFIQRAIVDHLAARSQNDFYSALLLSLFALIGLQGTMEARTTVAGYIAIAWRRALTADLLDRYLAKRAYYRLSQSRSLDNPDERLSQDISELTLSALNSFGDLVFAFTHTLVFLPIVLSIAAGLVPFLLAYAIIGSLLVARMFGSLTRYDALQHKVEADLRFALIRVRNNAEAIAFYRGEQSERCAIDRRVDFVFVNARSIIVRIFGLHMTETLYVAGVSVVPMAIIAPRYFDHQLDLGAVVQVGVATAVVMKTFSVFIHYYRELTALTASINRLYDLHEHLALEDDGPTHQPPTSASLLTLNDVTIRSPDGAAKLLSSVSIRLPVGTSLLVTGPSGVGKTSLLRAIAGIWPHEGTIERPPLEEIMFAPQTPYMVSGSFRAQLTYPRSEFLVDDGELKRAIELTGLECVIARYGGLDAEHHDWRSSLSLGEQQRIVFARIYLARPALVILDESTSALDLLTESDLYANLLHHAGTYISVGHRPSLAVHHDVVLELSENEPWRIRPTSESSFAAV
jgi:putative ATP-binding cassette transporter